MRIIIFLLFLITILTPTYATPRKLSLDDAILLAVRENPNVISSRLSETVQKFNLEVQEWGFKPHYAFQATGRLGSGGVTVLPGISLLTPIGTQLTLSASNTALTAQIMQPLMRGFGKAVVEAALENAKDSESIAKLNIEGTLRTTVTSVINAYLDVMMAEQTIKIDKEALARAIKSVEQTRLYIKAGHKAGNELVTVKANVASAQSQLTNDDNNLIQARYGLLTAIGVDPNAEIVFDKLDVAALIKKYHLPAKQMATKLILENDIQYQVDQITLHGSTSRNVLLANDNARWQLNLTVNAGENGSGVFNYSTPLQNVNLSLTVPIDDQPSKQAILNARTALKQAELALLQEKWNKETTAINGWNATVSANRSMRFAEDAEHLQDQTYHISYQKYLHGLIDSLELQSAQNQLIQSQQTLLGAQVGYIKALVNMDMLTGHTLKTWKIGVRL